MIPTSDLLMQWDREAIARTFNRNPVVWEKGEGCRLWDRDGRVYLDFFGGNAVMSLGYGFPSQQRAMLSQFGKIAHGGNLFHLEAQIQLARKLKEITFGEHVAFSNSGAEIIELAIKLARKYSRQHSPQTPERYEIITMRRAFHGRTFGALTATGNAKYQQGIEPLLSGFRQVPFNDFAALAQAASEKTCAVLLEPVQGEGGVWPAEADYLQKVRELCTARGWLLVFDEIQCGLGRCGRLHAYEHYRVVPDVLLLGKPLGGGFPLSALVAQDAVMSALQIGDHGSTFGGNPVAAAGGLVLLDTLSDPAFMAQVRATGEYLGESLRQWAAEFPKIVTQVRGLGMIWGLELSGAQGPELVRAALQSGLVLNCTSGNVLRLTPPLIITRAEVDEAGVILKKLFQSLPS